MMRWTAALDRRLRRCAQMELSFAQTAERLGGGMTRNMVAGRAHRLGISFAVGDKTDLMTEAGRTGGLVRAERARSAAGVRT